VTEVSEETEIEMTNWGTHKEGLRTTTDRDEEPKEQWRAHTDPERKEGETQESRRT
jgi:hypothetical protein